MWKYLFSMLFLVVCDSYAVSCVSGCNQKVDNTINQSTSASENKVGKVISSDNVKTGTVSVKLSPGTMSDWAVYRGDDLPSPGSAAKDWNYTKLDDYISIALAITGPCGTNYFPYNIQSLDGSTCAPAIYEKKEITITPRSFQSKIRIDKKIVSGTYVKNIFLAQEGRCQPYGCARKDVVYFNIYLNINLTVPQTCKLNAGDVIDVNFGNISSGAFKTAGTIAQGIQPQSRDISIKCDNIAGNAQLTMRMQADKTSGNIVVSDENNDVGFRVTNNNGIPLIPNNLSSVIPFTLDSNARQNVTIQVYPVSVTGKKPTEGPVTSRAYLRVDFP
ncbi:fimbrial protein [Enterobacter mori]